ncbi:MAG: hypothetical protein XD93_0865 [candidate division WS6 bacterium 34_10]|uniref:Uncharacterized protein n=1 Tax=candidate division WS6 bacterium 34_10 TaxID=1641389 RepID=A0A117LZT1_9BACT|nr:MAG: hypothetical protein XD93_0865 [candidate division WS6 bacterium 34_10]
MIKVVTRNPYLEVGIKSEDYTKLVQLLTVHGLSTTVYIGTFELFLRSVLTGISNDLAYVLLNVKNKATEVKANEIVFYEKIK